MADVEHDSDFLDGLADASLEADIQDPVAADLEVAADEDRLDRIAAAFALIIDAKWPFTFDHSRRVATYAVAIDAANHHERIDGHGYCRGLTGDDLTTTARILAVADVVDALPADRPYRRGMPPDRVRAILTSESGTHFDEARVDVCTGDVIEQATPRTVIPDQYVA